jgi:hypothetical protein
MNRKPFDKMLKTFNSNRPAQRHGEPVKRRGTLTLVGDLAQPLIGKKYGDPISLRVSGHVSNATDHTGRNNADYSVSVNKVKGVK